MAPFPYFQISHPLVTELGRHCPSHTSTCTESDCCTDQFHAVMRPTLSIALEGALRITHAPTPRPASCEPRRRRFFHPPIAVHPSARPRFWACSDKRIARWAGLVLEALGGTHPVHPGSSPPWEDGESIWANQLRAERKTSASEVEFRCFGEPHVVCPEAADAAQADVALSPWLDAVVVIP